MLSQCWSIFLKTALSPCALAVLSLTSSIATLRFPRRGRSSGVTARTRSPTSRRAPRRPSTWSRRSRRSPRTRWPRSPRWSCITSSPIRSDSRAITRTSRSRADAEPSRGRVSDTGLVAAGSDNVTFTRPDLYLTFVWRDLIVVLQLICIWTVRDFDWPLPDPFSLFWHLPDHGWH